MKKLNILIILSLYISSVLSAQPVKLRAGIKGGVDLAGFHDVAGASHSSITGLHMGTFTRLNVPIVGIQGELAYSVKGGELSPNDGIHGGTAVMKLHYIDLIGLVCIKVLPVVSLQAGMTYSMLTGIHIRNVTDAAENFDFESLNKSDFESADRSLVLGGSIDVGKFSTGARYNFGLRTIGKEKTFPDGIYHFPDVKNSVLQIFVAWSFL